MHRHKCSWVVKNGKHHRGSTQATIHPLAILLTTALRALVRMTALGSSVALILPPLCFLYYDSHCQQYEVIEIYRM